MSDNKAQKLVDGFLHAWRREKASAKQSTDACHRRVMDGMGDVWLAAAKCIAIYFQMVVIDTNKADQQEPPHAE